MRGHDNKTRFQCKHCDAYCQSATHLAEHEMIHTGEKPHLCVECGKYFRTKNSLKKHQISHREKKPFQCPKCDKAYCEFKSLTDHFKDHTGERPFSCELCKKKFKIFSNMRGHQKKAHVDIEERRKFKCELCEFKSLTEQKLNNHHQVVHLKIPLFQCNIYVIWILLISNRWKFTSWTSTRGWSFPVLSVITRQHRRQICGFTDRRCTMGSSISVTCATTRPAQQGAFRATKCWSTAKINTNTLDIYSSIFFKVFLNSIKLYVKI